MMADVRVIHGDMLSVLPTLDAESIDAVVTDPPYHLFAGGGKLLSFRDRGFMGQKWDGGDIAFRPDTWAEVFRVLKPGAHLVAFSGTRTYHRMVCAIEDAGFEVRDQLAWVYGSGFPKSHNIGKALDPRTDDEIEAGVPQSPESLQWAGWGTALKPAWEPIVLARKPLAERTVSANVLAHCTGAINVDASRIDAAGDPQLAAKYASVQNAGARANSVYGADARDRAGSAPHASGRWPANIVHDGSPEVLAEFAKHVESKSTQGKPRGARCGMTATGAEYSDAGSPARFFYSAKADAGDRLSSKHPTVKPVDLMRWLVRMVTPPGGLVLDPFAGSGTTGMACLAEGFSAVLIEREADYVADIKRRLAHVGGEDTPLFSSQPQGLFE